MKVEQEYSFDAILASVQRLRAESGTSVVIAWAKSAFITTASASWVPLAVTAPVARPFDRISRSTGSPRRMSTPISAATRAMAAVIALQPPTG